MRWLPIAALAACSNTTSRAGFDAAIDSKPYLDARIDAAGPDAYSPRACDAPPSFADGILPTRVLHVVPGAIDGDGSLEHPYGSISAAAAAASMSASVASGRP